MQEKSDILTSYEDVAACDIVTTETRRFHEESPPIGGCRRNAQRPRKLWIECRNRIQEIRIYSSMFKRRQVDTLSVSLILIMYFTAFLIANFEPDSAINSIEQCVMTVCCPFDFQNIAK